MTVKEYIINLFESGEIKHIGEKALSKRMRLNGESEKKQLRKILDELEKEDVLIYIDGSYSLTKTSGFLKGKIKTFEKGYAFFIPDDGSDDLFIPYKNRNGAYQGDSVYVRKTYETGGDSDCAEVVKITKRGVTSLSGIYYEKNGVAFVSPDDDSYGTDIMVARSKNNNLRSGEQVIVTITSYPLDKKPMGRISCVLGNPRDIYSRVNGVLMVNDVRTVFGAEVIRQIEKIPDVVLPKQAENRKDYRQLLTVTIDGDSAKDFDDAISVFKTQDGFELYVHIADVSEYVGENTVLDKEAYERGTSIYLPDRVIPMLPEKLSNGICSLNPNQDRLTLTVKCEYDGDGNIIQKSFYKSIIRSNCRMTYKKVQAFFDGKKEALSEYKEYAEMLNVAKSLQALLTKHREESGYVDIDVCESNIYFDAQNKLIVEKRESIESERLIEQFMIAANVAVAEFLYYADLPAVYRVHETPSAEKIENLCEFLKATQIGIGKGKFKYPKDFSNVLNQAQGKPIFSVVNDVVLRTMQKAVYSFENKGHFGLNEKCYCHFTSPIRRYPDLTVHRILKGVLDGCSGEVCSKYSPKVAQIAENCTLTERKADLVERTADDLYVCKFMSDFVGDFFEGLVSGVTAYGVYVRLENSAEGFIPLETLPSGNYAFDKTKFLLTGKKFTFKIGDCLLVKLVGVDYYRGKITFAFVSKQHQD